MVNLGGVITPSATRLGETLVRPFTQICGSRRVWDGAAQGLSPWGLSLKSVTVRLGTVPKALCFRGLETVPEGTVPNWPQSRSNSLIAVFARVCASTRLTMTAQARFGPGDPSVNGLPGKVPGTTTE
jgi:hypothetical protein